MLHTKPSHFFIATLAILLSTVALPSSGRAQSSASSPSLIITSGPIPDSLRKSIYRKPVEIRDITADDIVNDTEYYEENSTVIAKQVKDLASTLGGIQSRTSTLANSLNQLQRTNENRAAGYYASIATINTQLQSGTTPGNPRLVQRLDKAQNILDQLSGSMTDLNAIAVNTATLASEASFLLENTRAAYSVSGAIEEDHIKLSELEDSINNTITMIDRVLNTVNDDITRTNAYLTIERDNIRTLALGVSTGDFYGKSLAARPFSNATVYTAAAAPKNVTNGAARPAPSAAPAPASPATLSAPRQLAKITFDRPNIQYEQPVYQAVTEALKRYPNARFDLIAVSPSSGNAAEAAIETTRARRNAEKVLRTLTQLGLDTNRVDLAYTESADTVASEVHLFVK